MSKTINNKDECKTACEEFLMERLGEVPSDYSFISSESGKCYVECDEVWYDLANGNAVILDK